MDSLNKIEHSIDFSDSYYIYSNYDEYLHIYVNLWNDKIIKITFSNVLGFIYNSGSYISDLYETSNHPFIIECFKRSYEDVPGCPLFKLFVIIDIEDLPIFQIVAERMEMAQVDQVPVGLKKKFFPYQI